MIKLTTAKLLVSGACLVALSGCGLASVPSGYSPIEQQTVQELSSSNYTPRTEDERAAILTQDLFAQAAFWSREYDLNPADLEAAINLASTLRRLGNPRQSIEVAQTTRALYPRDVDLMAELAAAHIADNNPKDALPIIDAALGQRPNIARLWSLRGAALDQFEQFAEARQHYSKGLSIAPNNPGIIANVGLSYALEGDPKTAEIWLRRAANMPGASASTRQNLSLVLGLQNKLDEAEKWARRDLDQQAVTNNISYVRALRGTSTPRANIQTPPRVPTYSAPQPANQTTAKPYMQATIANYQRSQPAPSPQTRQAYGNPYQQPAKIMSPAPRFTNYGQIDNTQPSNTNIASARDAALAAAKQSSVRHGDVNAYADVRVQPRPVLQVPQSTPRQDLLGKISHNNMPKAKIAQLQQQQLAGRDPTQYQAQQPVTQQVPPNPYPQNNQPSMPYGVTVTYPNNVYPQTAQTGSVYGPAPQTSQEQPVSQPARQRRW